MSSGGAVDVGADLGHDGGTEGHVGHKMAVHDVDLEAVSGMAGRIGERGIRVASQRPGRWCLYMLCLALQNRQTVSRAR